jgi:hypothetical protein
VSGERTVCSENHNDPHVAPVYEQTEAMVQQVDAGVANEIRAMEVQVQTVMATKQAGVDNVNQQLRIVSEAEQALQRIDADVSLLMVQLASSQP